MRRLTKAQRQEIDQIIGHLQRAARYLQQDGIVVARKATAATTSLHLSRPSDGLILYPVAKDIGSDLTGLWEGIRLLRRMADEQNGLRNG